MTDSSSGRHLGLLGATAIGVGAIVGGGVLALAGVAFAAAGPGAILAFAANGVIAIITALSFAEMSARFPESGGTYTFAKKVLSVQAAFMVGWVVWFASIVAAVLYALGFATFAMLIIERLAVGHGHDLPGWLSGRMPILALALAATAAYTASLVRRSQGGGRIETIGKIVVFMILIVGGIWVLFGRPEGAVSSGLSPFLPFGMAGLAQAMGYTFIALQGFDLIAAVGGEVRDPGRTIPRAMLLSLAVALAVYLPLLFVLTTAGVPPGSTIGEQASRSRDTVVAVAVEHYMGPVGFWLVMVAAVLSMLSALQANLYAASRIALTMARDRNLPAYWSHLDRTHHTPANAVLATAVPVAVTLAVLPDVAAAGAVSSLIFLLAFAFVHWMSILARRRADDGSLAFRLPLFPLIPAVGGLACLALAIFQGIVVPSAGVLALAWLGLGFFLYVSVFAARAKVVDAASEALDPELIQLRGRRPLVLVPVANPARAEALVEVANALAPPRVGRVLMLSVVRPPESWAPGQPLPQVHDAQAILERALTVSLSTHHAPEALTTIAEDPNREIVRVAEVHQCESLVLGFGAVSDSGMEGHLERMLSAIDFDVVILRSPPDWRLSKVRTVLVPVGGRRDQSDLRARLIGSLTRAGAERITYLNLLPADTSEPERVQAARNLRHMAQDEAPGVAEAEVALVDDVATELIGRACDNDLLVLGLKRLAKHHKVVGNLVLRLARETACGLILISRRG